MGAQPFAIGQGSVFELFLDGKKFGDAMHIESGDFQHDVESVSDGVLGEDANRFDHIHIGFTINLTLKLENFEKVLSYLQYRADVDAQSIPEQSVGLKLQCRGNGPSKLFAFSECSIGGMGLSSGGRTNRLQMKLPIKARYMKKI